MLWQILENGMKPYTEQFSTTVPNDIAQASLKVEETAKMSN